MIGTAGHLLVQAICQSTRQKLSINRKLAARSPTATPLLRTRILSASAPAYGDQLGDADLAG
jgi:hypothetical protein